MSDRSPMVPLLREETDDLERSLLESARDDLSGDDAARARSLAAARGALQAGMLVGAATAGITGWRWVSALGLTTTKVVWIGCVTALVAAGSASLMLTRDARPLSRAPVSTPHTARVPVATATATAERAPVPVSRAPSVAPPLAESPPRPAPRTAGEPTTNTPPSPSAKAVAPVAPPSPGTLHAETQLLQSVTISLASDPGTALSNLDAYDAQFPAGALAEDAGLLRVQALLAAGRRDEATRAAATFERRFPASAFVSRIRSLLANNP